MCEVKPEKEKREQTRLTVGGDFLDFMGNLRAPTASVTTEKCVFNSVLSTQGARCLFSNIKHFYLNNVLPDPEFMRIPLKIISQEIIDDYNLTALVDNRGWIHMCIKKGMYGLKKSRIIDNQELVKQMDPYGYHPVQHIPVLWVHDNIHTSFSLVVDNFCARYSLTEDADHFLSALIAKYLITVDMEATVYIGIKLEWDYVHRTVTLSIPNYARKSLHRFQHILRGGQGLLPPYLLSNPIWTENQI